MMEVAQVCFDMTQGTNQLLVSANQLSLLANRIPVSLPRVKANLRHFQTITLSGHEPLICPLH